jgi:hypothetical protein
VNESRDVRVLARSTILIDEQIESQQETQNKTPQDSVKSLGR